jgi:Domain of unknown function (DUF4373)
MKKEAYYFSHDSNAKDDPKILQLRMEMGWEGYGLFWALIEMLRNESDHKMRTHYKSIAFALHTQEDSIKQLINDFDLFAIEGEYFWSESLLKRMEMKESKSEKARQSAKKRWNQENDANAMRTHSDSNANAMQLKESKVKESKVNILTEESHNEIFRKLWASSIWLEGIAIKNKVTKEEVQKHLNDFRLECILKDELKVDEKDAKNHFINWMKRGNPIPVKEETAPKYAKSTIEDNWW